MFFSSLTKSLFFPKPNQTVTVGHVMNENQLMSTGHNMV